jgi:peptide deformylase
MILPIVGYGHPVLRKVGENISQEHPELKETIAHMYDTMYNEVLPRPGKAFRLFIIDTTPLVKMKICQQNKMN